MQCAQRCPYVQTRAQEIALCTCTKGYRALTGGVRSDYWICGRRGQGGRAVSDGEARGPVQKAPRVPNSVLRGVRKDERGESQREFADAMARVAWEMGAEIFPDESYVQRLESGSIRWPHRTYRAVLEKLCGRPVRQLGFAPSALSGSGGVSSRVNMALREAIWENGIELAEFAGKIGVNRKTAERWITRGVLPHPSHRRKASLILGIDESELWIGTAGQIDGAIIAHAPIDSPGQGADTIVLNLRLDGKELAVPISRRFLLHAGVSSFAEAFTLDLDMVHDILQRPRGLDRLTIASPAHLQEILIHLREQWHALVKTDNLLGPRFALAGVLNQISVVEALRSILRDEQRIEMTRLGAKYAESAAWLYEDSDNMTQARFWTSQAMEWAYEGDDERMLAWTIFRRAQQAAAIPDAAQTIGLAQAARRNEEKLATPTRAAIRVQEAYGHALDGNNQAAQQLLDEAHTWAAGDTVGDAREGHGSYCTAGYIEIQRGHCWLASGQPKKAISVYEDSLRTLPTVYQRNRAATLTRLAFAYVADSQPEQAANTAHAALPVARSAGSNRIVGEIKNVTAELVPYRALPAVAALLDELEAEDH